MAVEPQQTSVRLWAHFWISSQGRCGWAVWFEWKHSASYVFSDVQWRAWWIYALWGYCISDNVWEVLWLPTTTLSFLSLNDPFSPRSLQICLEKVPEELRGTRQLCLQTPRLWANTSWVKSSAEFFSKGAENCASRDKPQPLQTTKAVTLAKWHPCSKSGRYQFGCFQSVTATSKYYITKTCVKELWNPFFYKLWWSKCTIIVFSQILF